MSCADFIFMGARIFLNYLSNSFWVCLRSSAQLEIQACQKLAEKNIYPWGRLDYIRNSKTIKSVSVSVTFWKLIRKQFKSVSVISGV